MWQPRCDGIHDAIVTKAVHESVDKSDWNTFIKRMDHADLEAKEAPGNLGMSALSVGRDSDLQVSLTTKMTDCP